MGSRLNHSVGALNDNSNLWIIAWSKTVGDLRVAHFIGNALQVLPIVSFYFLKDTKLTMGLLLYMVFFKYTYSSFTRQVFFQKLP
jgi:hypothetical protein